MVQFEIKHQKMRGKAVELALRYKVAGAHLVELPETLAEVGPTLEAAHQRHHHIREDQIRQTSQGLLQPIVSVNGPPNTVVRGQTFGNEAASSSLSSTTSKSARGTGPGWSDGSRSGVTRSDESGIAIDGLVEGRL